MGGVPPVGRACRAGLAIAGLLLCSLFPAAETQCTAIDPAGKAALVDLPPYGPVVASWLSMNAMRR